MDKRIDMWQEVSRWIEQEKQEALQVFRGRAFAPALPGGRRTRAPRLRIVLQAGTAGLLLAAVLVLLWLSGGYGDRRPRVLPLAERLTDSPLFQRRGLTAAGRESVPAVDSHFSRLLGSVLDRSRPSRPDAGETGGQEQEGRTVSPAEVMQKIENVIRDKTLERLITRFYEISKEV